MKQLFAKILSDENIGVKKVKGVKGNRQLFEKEATPPLPLIVQANTGQPSISSDGTVTYSQDREDYVGYIPQMIKNGANLIGGCCGTDPSYSRRMAEIIKEKK